MKINMPTNQTGFTLIELMLVVLIIGILSSIATPLYQDFSSKAQVNSAYLELSTLKVPLDLVLFKGETIANTHELGWLTGGSTLLQSDPVVFIDTITGESYLEAVIDGRAQPVAIGVKIKLLRKVDGGWNCELTRSSISSWKDSYAPKQCLIITP